MMDNTAAQTRIRPDGLERVYEDDWTAPRCDAMASADGMRIQPVLLTRLMRVQVTTCESNSSVLHTHCTARRQAYQRRETRKHNTQGWTRAYLPSMDSKMLKTSSLIVEIGLE